MADPRPPEVETKLRRLVNLLLFESGARVGCVECRAARNDRDKKRSAEISTLLRETNHAY